MIMESDAVDRFVQACAKVQPELHIRSEPFFRGIIAIPISQEYLLQAYFIMNLTEMLGKKATLILYESPIPEERSDQGRVDLILLTDENKLLVVESKYIDFRPGRTKRASRTGHRKIVREQINFTCSKLIENYQISSDLIERAILTNDEKIRTEDKGDDIKILFVPDNLLGVWRERKMAKILQSVRSSIKLIGT